MKILLGLILCLIFQGIFLESSFALVDSNVREFLENRVNQWPELYLPNFKLSDTSKDLIYPEWFEGNWLVTSQNIDYSKEEYFEELLESTYELEIKFGYVIKWFAVRVE